MRSRLFLTCWIVFCLHFATDFVREHYLVVSIAEDASFDLDRFYGLHYDIFKNPPSTPHGGTHHGANPGISMLAAIPYAALRPLVDLVVARTLSSRPTTDTLAVYNDPREARVKFYREVRRRGLDVRFGLVGIITMVFCMAPLSAFGVVVMFRMLVGAGLTDRSALGLSLLYAFATPVLFRSAYLNQNLAVGVVALASFWLLWNPGEGLRWSPSARNALAGALAGFGFLCDYSGALALGILGLYAMVRAHDALDARGVVKSGAWFAAGALPMILALWWYQWVSFGNPFLPPQHWMPKEQILSDQGYQGVTGPNLALLRALLVDPQYGLFVSAPLLILALGAPFLRRRETDFLPRREALLCVGVGLAYLVFFSSIVYTRLQWSTGIRYLMPTVPFLFLAAAAVLQRIPKAIGYPLVFASALVSVAMAMVRNQYGVHTNVIHLFIEGLQLPWLNTLGKMSAQYAPWLQGRPSALPALMLSGAVIAAIWTVREPWKSPASK